MVENSWEICNSLDKVYGAATFEIIKEAVNIETEETQCAELNFFKDIIPDKDPNLIKTCTEIFFLVLL